MQDAQLNPESVDYINAHGTSTGLGDLAETKAMKAVFGPHAKKLQISSTKSKLGHLLGASGGVELIVSALAIEQGVIPPTINLDNPDEGCDLDYVPHVARETRVNRAMSNSFGFGGHNASLLIGRYDGPRRLGGLASPDLYTPTGRLTTPRGRWTMRHAKTHWEEVYSTKRASEVSWYQEHSDVSLDLIRRTGLKTIRPIIDVGGGASRLVDDLLANGYSDLTVLDISAAALNAARDRLGPASRRGYLDRGRYHGCGFASPEFRPLA